MGLNQEGLFPSFTADLDIPFRQGSFALAVPQFGGFDPSSAATFGFAILSDIEAFFLINAAQGDDRSNVLQRPEGDAVQRPAGLRLRHFAAARS